MTDEDTAELPPWLEPRPKRRGRPPGAKNRQVIPVPEGPRAMPPSEVPFEDYTADPLVIAQRQFSMLDWAQQAFRNEMKSGLQRNGTRISIDDIEKLERLSNGIVRAMDGIKKAIGAAEEMRKRLTPAQVLRHSIDLIKAQDLATQNAIVKELRQHRAKLAPVGGLDKMQLGEHNKSATSAIAELEAETE